jgi:hypothetical protein
MSTDAMSVIVVLPIAATIQDAIIVVLRISRAHFVH